MRDISKILEEIETLKRSNVQISIYANLTGPKWSVIFESKTEIMRVATVTINAPTAIIALDKALDNWGQIEKRLPEIQPAIEHIQEPPSKPNSRDFREDMDDFIPF